MNTDPIFSRVHFKAVDPHKDACNKGGLHEWGEPTTGGEESIIMVARQCEKCQVLMMEAICA